MTTITQTQAHGVTVLRVSGGLTHEGVVPVAPTFEAATGQPQNRIVIDLSEVPILTTPGLSLLLAGARRSQQVGGRMVVTGTRGPVDDLLRRCRLDAVLTLVTDPEQALLRAQE